MAPVLTSPLVSTQWLADHLGSDELVVMDASVRQTGVGLEAEWSSARNDHEHVGRVPGAVYADLVNDFSDTSATLPLTRPSAEQFERAAAQCGVTSASTVVVYDDEYGQWSSRLWWMFRSFGIDDVAVLDGGFRKWQAENRPIRRGTSRAIAAEKQTETPRSAFLLGEERDIWADKDHVARTSTRSDAAALVFAATEEELGAEHPPIVPGSTRIPAQALIDAQTNTFHKRPTLTALLEPVLGAEEVITYCGVGSAACVDALALTLAGHSRVRVYDGSLADWWRSDRAA